MALALDEPKETDTTVEEKGYTFCIDNQLLATVSGVTVDFSYAGFSVEPETPLAGGGACGSCSVGGGCGSGD